MFQVCLIASFKKQKECLSHHKHYFFIYFFTKELTSQLSVLNGIMGNPSLLNTFDKVMVKRSLGSAHPHRVACVFCCRTILLLIIGGNRTMANNFDVPERNSRKQQSRKNSSCRIVFRILKYADETHKNSNTQFYLPVCICNILTE